MNYFRCTQQVFSELNFVIAKSDNFIITGRITLQNTLAVSTLTIKEYEVTELESFKTRVQPRNRCVRA